MASSMRRLFVFSNICLKTVRFRALLKVETLSARPIFRGNSQISAALRERDPALYFFEENVQELMLDITGDDYDKTFRARKLGGSSSNPVFKFLTDEELQREVDALQGKRKDLLQFPPVLLPREEINAVLSKDPKLQGLGSTKIIFTDITYGKDDLNRFIVAREADGTLRHATWEERHRMNCIYFPAEGRSQEKPRVFQKENLQDLLDRKEYEFILDVACVQFEPNDPDYIEAIKKTYEEVNSLKDFDILDSTRHFGSLAFYLAFNGNIDNLLMYCIERRRISSAASLVKLLYTTHPEIPTASKITNDSKPEDVVQIYILTDSKSRNPLELLFKRYLDSKKM